MLPEMSCSRSPIAQLLVNYCGASQLEGYWAAEAVSLAKLQKMFLPSELTRTSLFPYPAKNCLFVQRRLFSNVFYCRPKSTKQTLTKLRRGIKASSSLVMLSAWCDRCGYAWLFQTTFISPLSPVWFAAFPLDYFPQTSPWKNHPYSIFFVLFWRPITEKYSSTAETAVKALSSINMRLNRS